MTAHGRAMLAVRGCGDQTWLVGTVLQGAPTLVLVPTALELARITDVGGLGSTALVQLCGFGPIAAAARSSQLLARLTPARVILLGIAGAFNVERDALGTALEFGAVAVSGVGVGEGREHVPPPKLGFPQWPAGEDPPHKAVYDRLELEHVSGPLLLTTCAASGHAQQATERMTRFPEARAEDMEGFAVALSCALAGVPLSIVRGISNQVGDRAPENWAIPRALAAARELALTVIERGRIVR
jgi:futalosine hydrolase